jgi:Leucine-rich repeat (LRR) protein
MKEKVRKCPRCHQSLNYEEFVAANHRKYSPEKIDFLWNCEYLRFYCCHCYNIIREKKFLTTIKENPYKTCAGCNKSVHFSQFRQTYSNYSVETLIKIWKTQPYNIYCEKCYNEIIRREDLKRKKEIIQGLTHQLNEGEKQFLIDIIKQRCLLLPRLDKFRHNRSGFTVKNNHIKTLILSNSDLKTIPESIGNLKYLRFLDLSSNQLKRIPKTIGSLTFLKLLRLEYNQLSNLPSSMKNLKNLTQLFLEGNDFKKLPEIIKYLTELRYLEISRNQIQQKPSFLNSLHNLKILYMMNCGNKDFVQFIRQTMNEKVIIVT